MARAAIGVDLGGSHVTAAVVDEAGEISVKEERDIDDRRPPAVVACLTTAVKAALDGTKHEIAGIGIGSPGNVDLASGTIRYSPNFGWHDVPLGELVRAELPKTPVFVGNDARCATLGEYAHGVGQGTQDFVLLTLGTGIGGGIVSGGVLALGYQMGAGEFGHHQIRPESGFMCGCGKIGCFEAQASGTGLIRHAIRVAPSFPRSTLLDVPREKLGSKAIRKAAQAGDPHATAAFNAFCDDLALGLANVVAAVNPEVIALGGGVSSAGDFLLDRVRPLVDARTTMVPRGTTRIVRATLGNDAGAVGAATAALRGGLIAQRPPLVSVVPPVPA
ncbi:MAG: ROK family protein [Candidatus Eremiobacteraeota bacterium]|nr:ROK family protein [Candidatus Eremiobacteraeota bacterium]